MTPAISGSQIAAGRILSGVSRDKLAVRSGVAVESIQKLEIAGPAPLELTADVEAVAGALDSFGVIFVDEGGGLGAGVRLKFTRGQTAAIGAWEGEGGVVADDDVP